MPHHQQSTLVHIQERVGNKKCCILLFLLQLKQQISLRPSCGTFKWHVQSFHLHVTPRTGKVIRLYGSFFIFPGSLNTPPCPLSLKYDPPLTEAPPRTPSPFIRLKSAGHMCFIRIDRSCTLAAPLPTSHLSWLETFYSCQLFQLTLPQIPRKSSWWWWRRGGVVVTEPQVEQFYVTLITVQLAKAC